MIAIRIITIVAGAFTSVFFALAATHPHYDYDSVARRGFGWASACFVFAVLTNSILLYNDIKSRKRKNEKKG